MAATSDGNCANVGGGTLISRDVGRGNTETLPKALSSASIQKNFNSNINVRICTVSEASGPRKLADRARTAADTRLKQLGCPSWMRRQTVTVAG